MSHLIDQLTQLQQLLLSLRKKHLETINELETLKNSPAVSLDELNEHKRQLVLTNEKVSTIQQQLSQEQERYQTLEQRYQSLADSHNAISEQNEQLTHQNEQLTQQVHILSEKNRIAAEHTQLVLERLRNIDSEV